MTLFNILILWNNKNITKKTQLSITEKKKKKRFKYYNDQSIYDKI
jgi:hypothetical protein